MVSQRYFLLAGFLVVCPVLLIAQTIRYVKPTATGTGTGGSWGNASADLQGIINASAPNDQVWVAIGTYYPTRNASGSTMATRDKTFTMRPGVKVYGSFLGVETTLADRLVLAFRHGCILSGDLEDAGDPDDNAYHVVTFKGANSESLLDGFTIQDGNANGESNYPTFVNGSGGGVFYPYTGSAGAGKLVNCAIQNNRASDSGGGIYMIEAYSPAITSCVFTSNTAAYGGGAVGASYSIPTFTDCQFNQNVVQDHGGAVSLHNIDEAYFTNCLFTYNRVVSGAGTGGAVNTHLETTPSPRGTIQFLGCAFLGNSAIDVGSAVYSFGPRLTLDVSLINCTVSGNSGFGAAVHQLSKPLGSGQLTVTNSIIWGNTATGPANAGIESLGGASPLVRYSDVQNCSATPDCPTGAGNLSVDPGFAGSSDLRLRPTSPAINAGDPTATTSSTAVYPIDLSGLPRIVGSRIDMGALENQMTDGVFSINNDFWDDPFQTWSCQCLPSRHDDVFLLHSVTTPYSYTAQARNLRYGSNGRLQLGGDGVRLQMGVRVRYVKPVATGTGDGSSWSSASGNLVATLAAAQSGEEVWVQDGLYKPSSATTPTPTDRAVSFSIASGVRVYGGFRGSEINLNQRNDNLTFPLTTTLSGGIGATGFADNSYHVVQFQNAAPGTVLDGFMIREGGTETNTESPVPPGGYTGGGIYNAGTTGQISSPTIQNCRITANRGAFYGGGLFNIGAGTVTLRNCLFDGNYGEYGGAIASPATATGAGSYTSSVTLNVINCTIVNNSCLQDGKATFGGLLNITNSIIWGNGTGSGPTVFGRYANGSRISYSTVQDGSGSGMYVGSTVSNTDPKFVAATNYQLRPDSPCINRGNPDSNYNTVNYIDLAGRYRIFLGQVDMGCFEFGSFSYQYP